MQRARPFGHTPEQAAAIRRAADLLTTTTTTTTDISKEWNARGFHRAEGKQWSTHEVRRTLLRGNTRALLDADAFTALEARLLRPGMEAPTMAHMERLSGLARCGTCGAGIYFKPQRGEDARYTCTARNYGMHVRDGRSHPQVRAHIFEGRVRQRVVEEIAKHGSTLLDYTPRSLGELSSAIGTELRLKQTLLDLVDTDGAAVTQQDITPRLRRIEAEVTVLEAERADRVLADVLERVMSDDLEEVAEQWDALDIASKQVLARRLVTVTVYVGKGPERVHVESVNA